jgi:hypothetical protein
VISKLSFWSSSLLPQAASAAVAKTVVMQTAA